MTSKRVLALLLAASVLSGGCAKFLVPTKTSAVFTAAERDAFYAMVDQGVIEMGIGISVLLLISRIVEQPIPDETIRDKWVPRGVRAFVENFYVDTRDKRHHWKFFGEALYEANFSRTNNVRLYNPAANLAQFCLISGNSFRLAQRDGTNLKKAADLRPWGGAEPGLPHWAGYPAVDAFRAADAAVAMNEAQQGGAWGTFTCTRPDGTQAWWARVGPAPFARKNHGPSFALDLAIAVHETLPMTFPATPLPTIYEARDMAIHQAFTSPKPLHKEIHGVVIDVWSKARSTDRFGCREMLSTITYGDRIIDRKRDVVCL